MKRLLRLIAYFICISGVFMASDKECVKYPQIGVDTAGVFFLRHNDFQKEGWYFDAYGRALNQLGAEFIVEHYIELATGGSFQKNLKGTLEKLNEYNEFLEKNKLEFLWTTEPANWNKSFEFRPGQNLYELDPNVHYMKLPQEILKKKPETMIGVVYDELEHTQITNHQFISPKDHYTIPSIAYTTGKSWEDSYEALFENLLKIRLYHDKYDTSVVWEPVWPVMHHIFARAGWILCPKFLKESWNPVVASMALGAVIEYEDKVGGFWITPDLWFRSDYPGHSVEALKSALVSGHWLGAEKMYVENLDYVHTGTEPNDWGEVDLDKIKLASNHRDANGSFGSLVGFLNDKEFKLTSYGQAFKWYAKEYRFENPRSYTWRDVKCKVAIVRFPDSDWGQREEGFFRENLLGSTDKKANENTEAWFKIWHLLSNGTIPVTGISFNSHHIQDWPARFFCPMPPVLVFDHRIGDHRPDFDFREADIIYLTGVKVTLATQELIAKKVKQGITCISLSHLVPQYIRDQYFCSSEITSVIKDGKGKWIVTRDFLDAKAVEAIKAYLPPDDEWQFIFNDAMVIFKKDKLVEDRINFLKKSF